MRPTTRRTLESSMRHRPPVTRDLRPRQLPTVTSHAVPTGECQSDPHSRPSGTPAQSGPVLPRRVAGADTKPAGDHSVRRLGAERVAGDGRDELVALEYVEL